VVSPGDLTSFPYPKGKFKIDSYFSLEEANHLFKN